MSGVPNPSGMRSLASPSRSSTRRRAKKTSVPSSKKTVTNESPNIESERISSTFGRPAIADSTDTVTIFSTSSGESPGDSVKIATWTGVTSGNASIGRRVRARTPRTTRKSAAKMTRYL
jgi:hypothetical protein